jgi:hypothetical protein
MDPIQPGIDDVHAYLRSDGDSVPWTPEDILAEVAPTRHIRHAVPFVVQCGRALFIVEASDDGWTLAELDFNDSQVMFRESRRVTYTWPREAFGAMLSRLAGSDIDEPTVAQLTAEFTEWIGHGFARERCPDHVSC